MKIKNFNLALLSVLSLVVGIQLNAISIENDKDDVTLIVEHHQSGQRMKKHILSQEGAGNDEIDIDLRGKSGTIYFYERDKSGVENHTYTFKYKNFQKLPLGGWKLIGFEHDIDYPKDLKEWAGKDYMSDYGFSVEKK